MKLVKDWADKNNTFVYTDVMEPRGYVECVAPCEFRAYRADGSFVDWFTTKKAAANAL